MTDKKNREAHHSRDGYDYQLDQAIVQWLKLGPEDSIQMEGEEDFDLFSENGSFVVQTKKTGAKISLNQKPILETIERSLERQLTRVGGGQTLIYSTTGQIATERSELSDSGLKGIQIWYQAREDSRKAEEIKSFFCEHSEVSDGLKSFAVNSTVSDFQEKVIRPIIWNPLAKSTDELYSNAIELIRKKLKSENQDSSTLLCEQIFDSLFRRAAQAASGRGVDGKDIDGERLLTLLDLQRIFDGRTMSQISNSELTELRINARPIVGLDGEQLSASQVRAVIESHGSLSDQSLQEIDGLIDEGKLSNATLRLDEFQNSPSWLGLDSTTKSECYLTRVRLNLASGVSIEDAKACLEEARGLNPHARYVAYEAMLCLKLGQFDEAIKILRIPTQDKERRVKAIALLNLGKIVEAKALVEQTEPHPESHRLNVICALALGETDSAFSTAEETLKMSPNSIKSKEVFATVNYALGSGHVNLPFYCQEFPFPENSLTLPTDTGSLGYLNKAKENFLSLAEKAESDPTAFRLRFWAFASASNHRDLQSEALKIFSDLVAECPSHPSLITWGISRQIKYDWAEQIITYEKLEAENLDLENSRLLLLLYKGTGKLGEAKELLLRKKDDWSNLNLPEWKWELRQLAELAENFGNPLELSASLTAELETPKEVEMTLISSKTSRESVVQQAIDWFTQSKFSELITHKDLILRKVGSERLLELVVRSLCSEGQWQECLSALDENRNLFKGGRFPNELCRIRIYCLESLGKHDVAATEAKKLFTKTNEQVDRDLRDRLHHVLGKKEELKLSAQELLRANDVPPHSMLCMATSLQRADPYLSKCLIEKSSEKQLTPSEALAALGLSYAVDAKVDRSELWKIAQKLTGEPDTPLKILNKGEFEDLLRQLDSQQTVTLDAYRDGQIATHYSHQLLVEGLVRLSGHITSNSAHSFYMGSYGSRARAFLRCELSENSRLLLDITTLTLLDRFQLWSQLQSVFDELLVSPGILPYISSLIDKSSSSQPECTATLETLRTSVREKIEAGTLRCVTLQSAPDGLSDDDFGLSDLLLADLETNDFVCIEDRFMTSFDHIEEGPKILSFVNLLELLREREKVDIDLFLEIRHQLRISGYRFLLPNAFELVTILKSLITQDVEFQSSPLALTYTSYLNQCYLDGSSLHVLNPNQGNKTEHSELSLLMGSAARIDSVLGQIWRDTISTESKVSISNKLLENWAIPANAVAALIPSYETPCKLGAMFIHQVALGGLGLVGLQHDDAETDLLDSFTSWVNQYFALTDSELRGLIDDLIASTHDERIGNFDAPEVIAFQDKIWVFILSLEKTGVSRDALHRVKPSLIPERLGGHLNLEPYHFTHQTLWNGASRVFLSEDSVEVKCVDGTLVSLKGEIGKTTITIKSDVNPSVVWGQPLLSVLASKDESSLGSSLLNLVDRDEERCQQALQLFKEPGSASEKIHRISQVQDQLTLQRLKKLARAFKGGGFSIREFLPPSPTEVYSFLRISSDSNEGSLSQRIEKGAQTLIAAFDPAEAFWRLGLLPVRFPDTLKKSLQALDPSGRDSLLCRLEERGSTLLHWFHFADVFGSFGWEHCQIEDSFEEVDCFGKMLQLSWNSLNAESKNHSQEALLLSSQTWANAVIALIKAIGVPWPSQYIVDLQSSVGAPLFKLGSIQGDDALHPEHFSSGDFLGKVFAQIDKLLPSRPSLLESILERRQNGGETLAVFSGFSKLRSNELGSFLAEEIPSTAKALLQGSQSGFFLHDSQLREEMDSLISSLQEKTDHAEAALQFGGRSLKGPIPNTMANILIDWLENWQPSKPAYDDVQVLLPAKVISRLVRYADVARQASFDTNSFISKVAETIPADAEGEQLEESWSQLLEMIYNLTYHPQENEREMVGKFTSSLVVTAKAAPHLRAAVLSTLNRILWKQSRRTDGAGWRSLVELRVFLSSDFPEGGPNI